MNSFCRLSAADAVGYVQAAAVRDERRQRRQPAVRTPKDQVESFFEKVAILEEIATEENDGKVPVYSEAQKKCLTDRFKKLNGFLPATVEPAFAPGTSRAGRASTAFFPDNRRFIDASSRSNQTVLT